MGGAQAVNAPVRAGSPHSPDSLAAPIRADDLSRLMRPLIAALAVLTLVHGALLFVHPAGAPALEAAGTGPSIGVVFDMGGRGDKSFNDGAFIGADSASKYLDARVQFIEPGDGSDREAGLRLLASERRALVLGVGFIFSDDLTSLAKEYPDVNFAGVDFALATDARGDVIPPPANVAALKFREEEGAFLVGAMAALVGGSKKVGFLGGMDIPLIHKFEAGYKAGVKHVCPDCTVIAQYAGVTPEAFRNPSKGKELALSQYQQGVNVIFHASGSTGLGMFEAARAMGKGHYGIGVDADQYAEAPGFVLTSMVKGVSASVYDTIRRVKDGTFKGGIYSYGLKERGVGYIYDAHNKALIPDSVRARLLQLEQEIVDGRIKVPSTRS
jgi:basic membrane protein A and related proteins